MTINKIDESNCKEILHARDVAVLLLVLWIIMGIINAVNLAKLILTGGSPWLILFDAIWLTVVSYFISDKIKMLKAIARVRSLLKEMELPIEVIGDMWYSIRREFDIEKDRENNLKKRHKQG